MSKTIKVTYNSDTPETIITVDGKPFDTSRINGRKIEDWAYPFMMRKIKWNGFYDEMVEALGGEKEFSLVFEGSESDLNELKEAWEDAPVTIVSKESSENVVKIDYDENSLTTYITVNGKPFDTSRINGRKIEDWAYPFMIRRITWNGIYQEMTESLGGENKFTIVFNGSEEALEELKEALEDVSIIIVSEENSENVVKIDYDENNLTTYITVNGMPFDTSRINGREIADWAYPFTIRNVKWNGIFEEVTESLGGENKFTILFNGSEEALQELKEALKDVPVTIVAEESSENNLTIQYNVNGYDYLSSFIGDVSIDSYVSAWSRPTFYDFAINYDDIIGIIKYHIAMFLYYNAVYEVIDNGETGKKPNHHLAKAIVIASGNSKYAEMIGLDTDKLTEIYFNNNGSPLFLANRFKLGYFCESDFDMSMKYYKEAYNHDEFYSDEWEHDRYVARHILGEDVEDYIGNF